MVDDDKFLSRWAKRKAESRSGTLEEDAVAADVPVVEDGQDAVALADTDAESLEDPDDHPAIGIDIDSLTKDSDFTVFMHEKVPEMIRRRALRKLWLSDPIFANLDGMNDYDEDFTDSATVVEGLKAAYDESVKRMKAAEAKEAGEAKTAEAGEGADDEASEEAAASDDETEDVLEARFDDEDFEDGTDEA